MKIDPRDEITIAGRRYFPSELTPGKPAPDEAALESARSLRKFVGLAWKVSEPCTAFVPGFHLDAICEHLQAVSTGNIRNLLINIPPRHMKSLAVCVFWPAWEWITHPERRYLFASHAMTLSERDSVKCRRLIESPWYQENFGDRFELCADQNTKLRYDNNFAGSRIATSVGGSATGEGADRVIVDDPHNVADRESETKRTEALVWWDETMSTRLNDPRTGVKIIIMQRIHEKDLSGHVLEQGGYEHLFLPAEFEPARRCVTTLCQRPPIQWRDPREAEGQLLWKERIGTEEIADFKVRLGPEGYAGQFQQRPSPAGGALFRKEWFRYWAGRARIEDGEWRIENRSSEIPPPVLNPPSSILNPLPHFQEKMEDREWRMEQNVRSPHNPPSSILDPLPHYALLHPTGSQRLIRPEDCERFAVMDPAGTEPGEGRRPCYTVIQVWDVTKEGDMLLVHQYRRQVQAADAAEAATTISREFDVAYIAIEKDGIGLGVVQQVKRNGIAVRAIKARGCKEARSQAAEIRMANGQIYFPRGAEFLFELEKELLAFPRSDYSDQVDALSHAAMQVAKLSRPYPPIVEEWERESEMAMEGREFD